MGGVIYIYIYILEGAETIKWEETEIDRADDAAERDGTETIARIVAIGPLAIIAGDEDFAIRHDEVDLATGVLLGAVVGRFAPLGIINDAIGMLFIKHGEDAVFNADALAGEGNDALYQVLVFDAGGGRAGQFPTGATIGKNDDVATGGGVFFAEEMCPGNNETINDDAVVVLKGVFHAAANDIIRAEDKSIKQKSAERDGAHKADEGEEIFKNWMALEKTCLFHISLIIA